ncbi:MAG: hypothetical protein KDD62_01240, partial [Bdellovibrionales bacterium]|nr:hypothetical protein [Bdellovibrionales bacterium]
PQFTVFSAQALRDAKLVELNTDQDAIIAAKPDHNHPVLLTGRRLYYGYEGTLWSHGVDENDRQQRKQINESLAQIAGCTTNTSYQVCPTHIYFSSLEYRMWNRSDLQHGFKATNVPFLYRVE